MNISGNVPNTELHVVPKVTNMSKDKNGKWQSSEVEPAWLDEVSKQYKESLAIFLDEFALLGTNKMATLIESVKAN